MAQDHNDIYSIVERLRILEEGLDKNQRSVNQLSATFKPKTVAVLTAKTDPKNPMAGKMVGGCEEEENNEIDPEKYRTTVVGEDVATEDVLDKVKKSLTDYLKNLEDEIKTDSDLKDKKKEDSDLRAKDKTDRDLSPKQVAESPDEFVEELPWHGIDDPEELKALIADAQSMDYDEFYDEYSSMFDDPYEFWENYHDGEEIDKSAPIKTITNECGLWEVHGNEKNGFAIRHGNRQLPTRFKNLDEAELALEMFNARRRKNDEAQDYIDEA